MTLPVALVLGVSFVAGCWLLSRWRLVDMGVFERMLAAWMERQREAELVDLEQTRASERAMEPIEAFLASKPLDENHAMHIRYSWRVVSGLEPGDVEGERRRLTAIGAPMPEDVE